MQNLVAVTRALLSASGIASAHGTTESQTIAGKTISVNYSAPKVNNRAGRLFGKDGVIGQNPFYPVWRAGANAATGFHTDADLDIGGLAVPKGDYTLFIDLADPENWQLILNRQIGQWGFTYNKLQDLGHVKMNMSNPPSTIEELKYTITPETANQATLTLAWENKTASVPIAVK